VAEDDRAQAAESAFQAAVLTSRRRVWALVRRTGTEGLLRPVHDLPRHAAVSDRETQRVLELCLDAACALLVADAVPGRVHRPARRAGPRAHPDAAPARPAS
jgi:hypothetical protein